MLTISKQQLYSRYDSLPQDLREFLFSETNSDLLWSIGEANHLSDDKKLTLATIVGDVILGFIHPDDLAKYASSDLGIDMRLAQTLADEINKKILYSIRQQLIQGYQPPAAMGPAFVTDILKPETSETFGEIKMQEFQPQTIIKEEPKKEGELKSFFAELGGKSNEQEIGNEKLEDKKVQEIAPTIIHQEAEIKAPAKIKTSFGGLMGIFGGVKKKGAEAVAVEIQTSTSTEQKLKNEQQKQSEDKSAIKNISLDINKGAEDKGILIGSSIQPVAPMEQQIKNIVSPEIKTDIQKAEEKPALIEKILEVSKPIEGKLNEINKSVSPSLGGEKVISFGDFAIEKPKIGESPARSATDVAGGGKEEIKNNQSEKVEIKKPTEDALRVVHYTDLRTPVSVNVQPLKKEEIKPRSEFSAFSPKAEFKESAENLLQGKNESEINGIKEIGKLNEIQVKVGEIKPAIIGEKPVSSATDVAGGPVSTSLGGPKIIDFKSISEIPAQPVIEADKILQPQKATGSLDYSFSPQGEILKINTLDKKDQLSQVVPASPSLGGLELKPKKESGGFFGWFKKKPKVVEIDLGLSQGEIVKKVDQPKVEDQSHIIKKDFIAEPTPEIHPSEIIGQMSVVNQIKTEVKPVVLENAIKQPNIDKIQLKDIPIKEDVVDLRNL